MMDLLSKFTVPSSNSVMITDKENNRVNPDNAMIGMKANKLK